MTEAVTLKEVYEELIKIEDKMVTQEQIETLTETIAILSNPETMRQIADSMEDIKHGRVKKIESVKDLIKEF